MEQKLQNQIAVIAKDAAALVVTNENEFIAASEYIKANKLIQKRVKGLLDLNITWTEKEKADIDALIVRREFELTTLKE